MDAKVKEVLFYAATTWHQSNLRWSLLRLFYHINLGWSVTCYSREQGLLSASKSANWIWAKIQANMPPVIPCWHHKCFHLGAIVTTLVAHCWRSDIMALSHYKRRKSALTVNPIVTVVNTVYALLKPPLVLTLIKHVFRFLTACNLA